MNISLLPSRSSFVAQITYLVVPFPRGASGPNPRIPASSDTGETSVKLSTTYVEAVVKTATPTEDPSEASTSTTLRPSHERFARNNLPGFFSALRRNLVSNFHSHLVALPSFSHLQLHPREWPPFIPSISRLAQNTKEPYPSRHETPLGYETLLRLRIRLPHGFHRSGEISHGAGALQVEYAHGSKRRGQRLGRFTALALSPDPAFTYAVECPNQSGDAPAVEKADGLGLAPRV